MMFCHFKSNACKFFCAFLFLVSVLSFLPSQLRAEIVATHGEGFLEIVDGHKILHVKGKPYEMGKQYGVLMRDDLIEITKLLEDYVMAFGVPRAAIPEIRWIGTHLFKQMIPQEDMHYLKGVVDGVGNPAKFNINDLLLFNVIIDAVGIASDKYDMIYDNRINCSSLAVWGDLTVDGKMFQTRNTDIDIGTGIENFTLVTINKPEGKVPYANMGWTGLIGVSTGLSANGIGFGQIWASSYDCGLGIPWSFKVRRILSEAYTAEQAANMMSDMRLRTYGSNFVFGDGLNFQARVVETTKSLAAIFMDNDPKEDLALWNGEPYAIKIPNAVFRADSAMDPEIRSMQMAARGPDGDPRESGSYKNRYKGQADRILAYKNQGILIGKDEVIEISRGVAMRGCNLQNAVYNNTDLEFWLANAIIDENGQAHDAWTQPYYHYSLNEYLPTIALSEAKHIYAASQDKIDFIYEIENFGTTRDMHVIFSIQKDDRTDGEQILYLPRFSSEPDTQVITFYERNKQRFHLRSESIPKNLNLSGKWLIEAKVIDPETKKVIDVASLPLVVH